MTTVVDPRSNADSGPRAKMFAIVKLNGVPIRSFGIPVKLSETPGSVRAVPDEFGESTRFILREAGYSKVQIDRFFADGVV